MLSCSDPVLRMLSRSQAWCIARVAVSSETLRLLGSSCGERIGMVLEARCQGLLCTLRLSLEDCWSETSDDKRSNCKGGNDGGSLEGLVNLSRNLCLELLVSNMLLGLGPEARCMEGSDSPLSDLIGIWRDKKSVDR